MTYARSPQRCWGRALSLAASSRMLQRHGNSEGHAMINLEAGQVWRSKRDADNARRIISVTNKLQSLMIEYIRNGETVVEIGTSFRRWIDISGATLVEGQ